MSVNNEQLMVELKELQKQVAALSDWRYQMQRAADQQDGMLKDHERRINRLQEIAERNTQQLGEIRQGVNTIIRTVYFVCALLAGLAGLVVVIDGVGV